MLLILCVALAYAIHGAASQAWNDGRTASRAAGKRVKARTAAARRSPHGGVRAAAWTGTAAGMTAAGTWRVARGTAGSLATGARAGWKKGRQHATERRATKQTEQEALRPAGTPSWRHYLTGECPTCGHLPKATAAETDGCECDAVAWGCPCAQRVVSSSRRPRAATSLSCPDCGHDMAGPRQCACTYRGCPCCPAATPPADQPSDAEPVDLAKSEDRSLPRYRPLPNDDDPHEGDPMSAPSQKIDGEASTIETTRLALVRFGEIATQHLETAAAAHEQAKGMAAAAEQMLAGLTTADLDPQTLAEVAALQEQAARLEQAATELQVAAEGTQAAATAAMTGLNSRHGNVEEAVNSTPHAAQTGWYRH